MRLGLVEADDLESELQIKQCDVDANHLVLPWRGSRHVLESDGPDGALRRGECSSTPRPRARGAANACRVGIITRGSPAATALTHTWCRCAHSVDTRSKSGDAPTPRASARFFRRGGIGTEVFLQGRIGSTFGLLHDMKTVRVVLACPGTLRRSQVWYSQSRYHHLHSRFLMRQKQLPEEREMEAGT